MNKVIIINLNGNAYQLEEAGYEALRAYLETAAGRLAGNPDRDEIIADIEQAIADKFRALMGASKTVVSTKEVEGVIAEMGPVEDATDGPAAAAKPAGAAAGAEAASGAAPGPARRLYRIQDGAMLAGVCNGLAAYFNVDAAIIRIAFVVLTLVYGSGALLYVIMAVLIPSAVTAAEMAAARGAPSTAQEFIRRARAGYYGGFKAFGDRRAFREWRRNFRHEMRGWRRDFKREMRQNTAEWAGNWRRHWEQHPYPLFGWWIGVPVLRLLSTLVALLCVFSLVSLLATGAVFGILLPAAIPVWAGLIVLIIGFQVLAIPLKMMRHAMYYGGGYNPVCAGWLHFWNTVAALAFVVVLIWFAHRHSVQVHEAVRDLPHEIHRGVDAVREWWERP